MRQIEPLWPTSSGLERIITKDLSLTRDLPLAVSPLAECKSKQAVEKGAPASLRFDRLAPTYQ
jgi:hypothetical protein